MSRYETSESGNRRYENASMAMNVMAVTFSSQKSKTRSGRYASTTMTVSIARHSQCNRRFSRNGTGPAVEAVVTIGRDTIALHNCYRGQGKRQAAQDTVTV